MIYKRYEYYRRTGKTWSKWFPYNGEQFEWQLKSSKLKNEYKDE